VTLRVAPYSRTSHLVTWLTHDRGRLTTLVKGACRPKSQFLGQYDLYYTCELVYYGREQRGMPIARECTPIETRDPLRRDWRAALCAGYASDLTVTCAPPGEVVRGQFAVVERLFDSLAHTGMHRDAVPWFELQLLGNLGLAPRLTSCSLCGADIPPATSSTIAPRHGGAVCASCRPRRADGPSITLPADALELLRAWQRSPSPRLPVAAPSNRNEAWLESWAVLGMLLTELLGTVPTQRQRMSALLGSYNQGPRLKEGRP
jgi:DNA repair protein RecO (recombination protein O)